MHGSGTCSSFTSKPPNRSQSFEEDRLQFAFSSKFRDESCAAQSPFLDRRKSGHIHPRQHASKHRYDRKPKVSKPPAPSHHRSPTLSQHRNWFSLFENLSRRPQRVFGRKNSCSAESRGLDLPPLKRGSGTASGSAIHFRENTHAHIHAHTRTRTHPWARARTHVDARTCTRADNLNEHMRTPLVGKQPAPSRHCSSALSQTVCGIRHHRFSTVENRSHRRPHRANMCTPIGVDRYRW